MFNKKLKQKITALEKLNSSLNLRVSIIENNIKLIKFKNENPPLYKKGDKFDHLTVINVSLSIEKLFELFFISTHSNMMVKNAFGGKNNLDKSRKIPIKNIHDCWEYELVSNINGDKIKLFESQLKTSQEVKNSKNSNKFSEFGFEEVRDNDFCTIFETTVNGKTDKVINFDKAKNIYSLSDGTSRKHKFDEKNKKYSEIRLLEELIKLETMDLCDKNDVSLLEVVIRLSETLSSDQLKALRQLLEN